MSALSNSQPKYFVPDDEDSQDEEQKKNEPERTKDLDVNHADEIFPVVESNQINENQDFKIALLHQTIAELGAQDITEKQLESVQKHFGWCPCTLSSKLDVKQVINPMCRPFVETIDVWSVRSAISIVGILMTRKELNKFIFEHIGADSKAKSALINMKMAIDHALDSYVKTIHNSGSSFIRLSKAFALIETYIQNGGDVSNFILQLSEMEKDFKEQNKQLQKEIEKVVKIMDKSRFDILSLLNRQYKEKISKQSQAITDEENKYDEKVKKYQKLVQTFKQEEITYLQNLTKNQNKKHLLTNEIKQIRKEIEKNEAMDAQYAKMIEQENQKLEDINNKKIVYNEHYQNLEKTAIRELQTTQKQRRKELNDRIFMILRRIETVKKDLTKLMQQEDNEIMNRYSKKSFEWKGLAWVFKKDSNIETENMALSDIQMNYAGLKRRREEELKELDAKYEHLSKERNELSTEFQNQVKLLSHDLSQMAQDNMNTYQHEKIKEFQEQKIKKIEEMKSTCTSDCKNLKEQIQKYETIIIDLEADNVRLQKGLENAQQIYKENEKQAQENLKKSKEEWNKQKEKYKEEIKLLCKMYGYAEISKIETLMTFLMSLTNYCENIGNQFRQITRAIGDAKEAFNGAHFKDLLGLPTQNQKKLLLEISQCFGTISMLAYRMFQQPINALVTNNWNVLTEK